jgi:hypothetical protein
MSQKDYMFIRPVKGSLGPSEQISIEITILVGNLTIPYVATGKSLEEILVLEIRNGKHIFLSLQGQYQRTCFGLTLELLASFGGKGVRNVDPQARRESGGGMPDELWRMTDFIINHGQSCGGIFLERGDEGVCREIRACLDTARDFQGKIISEREMGSLSMAETLLRYLDALPESVIPAELYEKALRIGESRTPVIQVVADNISPLIVVDRHFTRGSCQCLDLFNVLHKADFRVACVATESRIQEKDWYFLLRQKLILVRAFAKVLIRSPIKPRPEELRRKEILIGKLLED